MGPSRLRLHVVAGLAGTKASSSVDDRADQLIHAPYPYADRFPSDTTHKSAEQIAGEYVSSVPRSCLERWIGAWPRHDSPPPMSFHYDCDCRAAYRRD